MSTNSVKFCFYANSVWHVGVKIEFGVRGGFFVYFFCGRKKVIKSNKMFLLKRYFPLKAYNSLSTCIIALAFSKHSSYSSSGLHIAVIALPTEKLRYCFSSS